MLSTGGYAGWDLGGAHLKVAHVTPAGVTDWTQQIACPLWQGLAHLEQALNEAIRQLPKDISCHAVTMTGELADIFASRQDGVRQLIDGLVPYFCPAQILIYAGEAGFVEPQEGQRLFSQVASANWMATAEMISQCLPQSLLIDIGSTTTDIVTIRKGIQHRGRNDLERLSYQELIYTGVVRTPVMSITDHIPFNGEWIRPAAEFFSTMADVYRLCKRLPEGIDLMATPDNAGKSMADSTRRFARMLGCDAESATQAMWRQCAEYVAEQQIRIIADACARSFSRGLLDESAPLVGAGSGRFLVPQLASRLGRPYIDFVSLVQHAPSAEECLSSCAPAVAVANLARLQLSGEKRA